MIRPEVKEAVNVMKKYLDIQYVGTQFDSWERSINKKDWTQKEKDYALGFVNERRNEVRTQLNK